VCSFTSCVIKSTTTRRSSFQLLNLLLKDFTYLTLLAFGHFFESFCIFIKNFVTMGVGRLTSNDRSFAVGLLRKVGARGDGGVG